MLRFTTLVAIAIAVTPGSVLAAPATEHGESDGQKFEYTTELRANGVIHFDGVVLGSREEFALDVTPRGHVTGVFADSPVEFEVSKKLRDSVAAHLAGASTLASN